ncbi:MAG: universal stress protein [Caldilineaceae bacterium]|nr:universal stress protein [Caldilineaceae bacterium]
MYQTIVIPLDLSDTAEKALAYVSHLAVPHTSRLVIVHSIEPQQYAFGSVSNESNVFSDLLNTLEKNAVDYLTATREKLEQAGYAVTIHVAQADAAQFIVDIAVSEQADLIAMTTHGRTGFARWALGSVADRVIRTAHHPVFLVRSDMSEQKESAIQQILVPLDGSSLAEAGVQQAKCIASRTGATLVLLRVIAPLTPWEKQILNQTPRPAGEPTGEPTGGTVVDSVEQARRYLGDVAQQLREEGIVVSEKLFTGSPADVILTVASEEQMDLIVMNTHGYGGYTRWVYGSVANRVLHNAPCPLLLNRALPKEATLLQETSG